jgi:hypothetical protein
MKRCLIIGALILHGCVCAAENVSQFDAWGTRGQELVPVPNGWTQVRGEPRVRELPHVSQDNKAAGFIAFERSAFEEVYPDTVPAWYELNPRLQAFACRGEYEPLTLGIYALENLQDVTVSISEIKTDKDVLPTNHFDVRWVRPIRSRVSYKNEADKRYRLAPFYLEKHQRLSIEKGSSAQVWITFKTPDSAEGGEYTGKVSVQARDRASVDFPVRIRVLPMKLPSVPIGMSMYYARPAANPALREKELIDMREHGINSSVAIGVGAQIVSRDRDFGADDVEATRRATAEGMELRRKVYGAEVDKWPVVIDVGHQVLYSWDGKKFWFEFWPRSEKVESDFIKAIQVTTDSIKRYTKAPLRLFVMDEPGGHPENLKDTLYYNSLAKRHFPELTSWCSIGGGLTTGIDEISILGKDVDVLVTNRFTPDILKRLLARMKPYGVYNAGSSAEAVNSFVRDRYFFGVYGWKTGASEITQWAYNFGNPWKEPFRSNHGYAYPAEDGPIPSIAFESIREGIDDYRYHDLLWRMVTVARKSGSEECKQAASKAEDTAREIMNEIDFDFQRRGSASAPASSRTMEKWRWRIAAACLELLKHVKLDAALSTEAVRPGPLEFELPDDGAGEVKGKNLIPDGSFENGAGVWKGVPGEKSKHGTGEVDSSIGHNSKSSFKLHNSDAASGASAMVCVYGWGKPMPEMVFSAGKTYEFSGWIKSDDTSPQLRLAIPDKKGSDIRSGEFEPVAGGWRRTYTRVTMTADATPTYFAVWLQGPGTAWCDDLSVHEVEVAPLEVDMSTDMVDASDRAISLVLKQSGGTNPLKVRVTIPGATVAQEISIEPRGSNEVIIDPATLTLGNHEIRAQIVGTDQVRKITVRRVIGPFEK